MGGRDRTIQRNPQLDLNNQDTLSAIRSLISDLKKSAMTWACPYSGTDTHIETDRQTETEHHAQLLCDR